MSNKKWLDNAVGLDYMPPYWIPYSCVNTKLNEKDQRIAELEQGELARCAEESEKQSEYEGVLLDRIAELEKGLEIAQPILRSAYKQQWSGAYNAFEICSSLLKEQGE